MKNKIIYACSVFYAITMLFMVNVQAQETNDSIVNVAFGKIAKDDLPGGISSVNIPELLNKNFYTYSLDGLQSFVGGYNGNIWGQGPLVLIDGFPMGAGAVVPTEIESVTILKGANAVVLYGSRAAKGVVLITTKRGIDQPLEVKIRINSGLHIPKAYPKYLNSPEYMELYNEARANDNETELYSQDQIDSSREGSNIYRYPDMDFYSSEYLKDFSNRTDFTTEIFGGNDRTRYYSNFGGVYSNGLVKFGEQKKDHDLRFNMRANVDMKLSDWLSAYTNAAVVINDNYRGRGDFWGSAANLRPNWFAPLLPINMIDLADPDMEAMVENARTVLDGKYLIGGTQNDRTHTFGDMLAAGYVKNKSRTFMFKVGALADLSGILEGLSFKTSYSLDYEAGYSEAWRRDYAVYVPTWGLDEDGNDKIISINKENEDTEATNEFIGNSIYSQIMSFSGQFDYERIFEDKHNFAASLIAWGFQYQNSADESHEGSSYHRLSNANLGVQLTYNFNHKYYADFSGAIVHSAKLPKGNRSALSPTGTLGWRLSEEAFIKDNLSFVDNLKLNASYSKLNQDIDISDFYMYKGYFDPRGGWYQWRDGSAGGWTTGSARGENLELSFVKRNEIRAGLEMSLFDRTINLDANYFLQYTDGLLTQGSATIYPSYYSNWDFSYLPYLNYNKDKRTGFDFTLLLNKQIGQVNNSLGFSGMVFSSEVVRRDEIYDYDYQYRTGKALDAYWGLIAEGFFQDEDDIANHAEQSFGTVKPGDIKYRDVNNDGVIDDKDQVDLGHNGWAVPPFTYGLHYTLKYKNFTLFAMGTGIQGAIGFKNSGYYWIRGNNKYSEVVWDRWTEETKDIASFPRLTTGNGDNNYRNSTFWMYKTNRFDLSRVQLTYDFSEQSLANTFIKGLSIYVSGSNLLTVSKERKHMEMNIGGAPQTRFINLGVNANF